MGHREPLRGFRAPLPEFLAPLDGVRAPPAIRGQLSELGFCDWNGRRLRAPISSGKRHKAIVRLKDKSLKEVVHDVPPLGGQRGVERSYIWECERVSRNDGRGLARLIKVRQNRQFADLEFSRSTGKALLVVP